MLRKWELLIFRFWEFISKKILKWLFYCIGFVFVLTINKGRMVMIYGYGVGLEDRIFL